MKIIKKFTKEGYICPECGEKQTSLTQWQTVSVAYEYDFATQEWEKRDEIGGNFVAWACPSCGKAINVPKKMNKNIR